MAGLAHHYRVTRTIGAAMIASLLVYVVEMIRARFAPFEGFARFPQWRVLRDALVELAVAGDRRAPLSLPLRPGRARRRRAGRAAGARPGVAPRARHPGAPPGRAVLARIIHERSAWRPTVAQGERPREGSLDHAVGGRASRCGWAPACARGPGPRGGNGFPTSCQAPTSAARKPRRVGSYSVCVINIATSTRSRRSTTPRTAQA